MHKNLSPELWFYHRVSYGETDTMGYVYHAEYFHIFERARGEYMRHLGMSYAEVEHKGVMLPVYEATCRYYKPAYYDDLIHIHLSLYEMKKASLSFNYTTMDASRHTILAKGSTKHACVTKEGRPQKFPSWFVNILTQEPNQQKHPTIKS